MNKQITAGVGTDLELAYEGRGVPDDRDMTSAVVHGFVHDRFGAARDAFAANLTSGDDVGASFCATVDGETVVDLWGGYADEARTRPWTKDTIVNVYSTTKTMAALTALLLADRGELDVEVPVAKYWPEFAACGKQAVKVSHVMSHSSGLSGWREPFTGSDLYDAERAARLLAAQAPLWEPGTASGYHVYTFGFLIGEVVRRITGKTLGNVFREEIAAPLEADFWIGLPASEDPRVADLIPMPLSTNFKCLAASRNYAHQPARHPGRRCADDPHARMARR